MVILLFAAGRVLGKLSLYVERVTRTRNPGADADSLAVSSLKLLRVENVVMDGPVNGVVSSGVHALGVLRVRPQAEVRLTWQTVGAVLINTHWVGRRLWCAEEECPGCEIAPTRTVAYAVVMCDDFSPPRPMLLETTPNELARLHALCELDGLEIGSGLCLVATKGKTKSPLRLQPQTGRGRVIEPWQLPRFALGAAAVLAGIRAPRAEASIDEYFAEVRPSVRRVLETAIARL